jgi:hypothetical protein
MTLILFSLDHRLHDLLRVFLPLPMATQFLLQVVFVEIGLFDNPSSNELLEVVRQTEELLLVDRVDQRLSR